MSTELGSAYLSVIPSLKGAKAKLNKDLGGIDITGAAKSLGSKLAKGITSETGTKVVKGLTGIDISSVETLGRSVGAKISHGATEGFNLDKIGEKITAIGSGLTGVGTSLTSNVTAPALSAASAVAKIAVTGAAAATAVAGISLGKGFSRLVQIDSAKKKLEGLGHSAEEVELVMTNANAAVKGTAYGLGDAAAVAAAAVASGIEPGERLESTLKTIGDTATIAGMDFASSGAIFNSVLARGKLQGDDMLQLTSRGVPVLDALAKHLGTTTEAVSEMVSDGEIDFQTFADSMDEYLGGSALKSGQMFTGALANMGAAIGRVGANFLDAGGNGNGFFTQLIPLMGDATEGIGGMEEAASAWGAIFGDCFAMVIDKAKELSEELLPENFDMSPSLAQANDIKNAASDIIDKAGELVVSFKKWGDGFGEAFGVGIEKAKELAAVLLPESFDTGPTGAQVQDMCDVVSGAFDFLIGTAKTLKGMWEDLPSGLKDTIKQGALLAPAFGPALTVGGKITSAMGGVVSATGGAIGSVATLVLKYKALRTVKGFVNSLDIEMQGFTGSSKGATKTINPLKSGITGVKTATKGAVTGVKNMSNHFQSMAGMSGLAKGALVGLAVAGIALVVSKIVEYVQKQKEFELATDGLRSASLGASSDIKVSADGVAVYSMSLKDARESVDKAIDGQARLAQSMKDANAEASADSALLAGYKDTIDDLMNKSGLTADEQARLKLAVDGVNDACGTAYSVVDSFNGKIQDQEGNAVDAADAIDKLIEKQMLSLRVDSLEDQYKDALQERESSTSAYADSLAALTAAEQELNDLQAAKDDWAGPAESYTYALAGAELKVKDCREEVSKATELVDSANDSLENVSDRMSNLQQVIDGNASKWQELTALKPEIEQTFGACGKSASDLGFDLTSAGADLTAFGDLSAEELADVASSYNGSFSSIKDKLAEYGVKIDETKASTLIASEQMASDFDFMSGQVGNAFVNMTAATGMSKDEFCLQLSNAGVSVEDFQSLSADQLAFLVSNYSGSIDQTKIELDRFVADNAAAGADGGQKFADSLAAKKDVSVAAALQVTGLTLDQFEQMASDAGVEGDEAVANYAMSLAFGKDAAAESAGEVTGAADDVFASADYSGRGEAAAKGFATGMTHQAVYNAISSAASNVVSYANSAIKVAQGENSPAKLFKPRGSSATEGYAAGMAGGYKFIDASAKDAVSRAADGFSMAAATHGFGNASASVYTIADVGANPSYAHVSPPGYESRGPSSGSDVARSVDDLVKEVKTLRATLGKIIADNAPVVVETERESSRRMRRSLNVR